MNGFPDRVGPITLTTAPVAIKTAEKPLRLLALLLSNYTTGSQAATVWVVPAGASPLDSHIILGAQVVPPNTMIPLDDLNVPLAHNDRIIALASANVAVNLTLTVTDDKR